MPETDAKKQPDKKAQNLVQFLSAPPAVLLRFRKPLIVLTHIFAFAASLMLSFLVIHNMQFKRAWFVDIYPTLLLFMLIVKLPVFGLFKQYRGWWRYVGISDLISIVHASLTSTLIIVIIWFLASNTEFAQTHLPPGMVEPAEGVCIADLFATVLILAGLRMIIRLYYESSRTVEAGRLIRFLIVGAGNAGEALLREIHRMPVVQYQVIGLIDDDPAKQGTHIHGIQ